MELNIFESAAVQMDSLNAITDAFGAAKFAVYVTQLLIGDGIMVCQQDVFRLFKLLTSANRFIVPM